MKDETKTLSELYMDNSGSCGSVDDSVYLYNISDSYSYESYEVCVDGKKLVIPKDITPYESAKLSQFLFVANQCMNKDVWSIVEELEIQRLFK